MSLRLACLALLLAACTKTADTAATSTSAGADVQPPATSHQPLVASAPPQVLNLPRPAGGEWMGLYLQGKKAGWAFTDVKTATLDGVPVVQATSDVALSATIGGAKTERQMHELRFYEMR